MLDAETDKKMISQDKRIYRGCEMQCFQIHLGINNFNRKSL